MDLWHLVTLFQESSPPSGVHSDLSRIIDRHIVFNLSLAHHREKQKAIQDRNLQNAAQ